MVLSRTSEKDYLNVTDASRIFGVARSTILNWIKERRLEAIQLPGGNHRIKREAVVSFMQTHNIPMDMLDASSRKRILLVDDDSSVLAVLVGYLEAQPDVDVRIASSGFSAGVMTREFKPHMIVLDIGLEDIDGREVCRIIRENPEISEAQVIGISGIMSRPAIDSMIADGFDDFLVKPIDKDVFLEKVGSLLNLK